MIDSWFRPTNAPAVAADRRVDLDRLQLARPLERGVRLPGLHVARPRDQRVAVPEADRVAVPARHRGAQARNAAVRDVLHVELAADVDVRDEVARDTRRDLHEVRRRDDVVLPDGERVVAPHEAFGPAEGRRPDRVAADLVVGLLHRPLLVLRRQQRQQRRDLRVRAPVPRLLVARARHRALVDAVPLDGRKVLERVDARAAAAARLLRAAPRSAPAPS